MNLLRRIENLERLRPTMPADGAFMITHAEFLTLTLAENALRHPDIGKTASAGEKKEADRIDAIRCHPKRIHPQRHVSGYSRPALREHTEAVAAAMRPRILRLKEAFESGDQAACGRQRAKDRKALRGCARTIVARVEAEIGGSNDSA